MFLPYKVDVPMERWPIANWVLISVTIVISIAGLVGETPRIAALARVESPEQLLLNLYRIPPFDELPLYLRLAEWRDDYFRPYQLFTNVLVHDGIFHLAGNMFFLFVFGNAVNAKLGQFWYLTT